MTVRVGVTGPGGRMGRMLLEAITDSEAPCVLAAVVTMSAATGTNARSQRATQHARGRQNVGDAQIPARSSAAAANAGGRGRNARHDSPPHRRCFARASTHAPPQHHGAPTQPDATADASRGGGGIQTANPGCGLRLRACKAARAQRG